MASVKTGATGFLNWLKGLGTKGGKTTPAKKSGGGLLGRVAGGTAKGVSTGGTFAGVYGLGKLLGGTDDAAQSEMEGPAGGFGTSRGFGTSGGPGSSNYTPAAAATSVLSDADSSDPIVRQLQDIERVLVSIKGDTATLAAGMGGLFGGKGKNNNALQGMFGREEKSTGDMRSFLPLLLAALATMGFFNTDGEDGEDGGPGGFVDKDGDGLNDIDQPPGQASTTEVMDPMVTRKVLQSGRPIGAAADVAKASKDALKEVVVTAKQKSLTLGRTAANTVNAAGDIADAVRNNNVVGIQDGKPIDTQTPKGPPEIDLSKPAANADIDVPGGMDKRVRELMGTMGRKVLPVVGDLMTFEMMMAKLGDGDIRGFLYEAASLAATYGSAKAAAAVAAGTGGLGTPISAGIIGAGTAASTAFDIKTITRDIYKAEYGVFPKDDDPELREKRFAAIYEAVEKYANELISDFVGQSDKNKVKARPTVKSGSGMGISEMMRVQKEQKEWDEMYGETHFPDGYEKVTLQDGSVVSAKDIMSETDPNFVGPPSLATAIEERPGIFGRMMNRAGDYIDETIELGKEAFEGIKRVAPGLKITSDTVEISTDTAERVDREEQARQFSNGVGESVAMNQKIQSTGVIPNMPEVNVSVSSPKTSHPTGMHEISWIGDRIQMLT